jgi:NADP-dependent 3-hydroxy acid dehydrogenase YdfG
MWSADVAATVGSCAISGLTSGHREVKTMDDGTDVGGRTRIALVTGGTGGMGRAIALKLAADGYDVAVAYMCCVDPADAIVDDIEGRGRKAASFAADIGDEGAVSALFDAVHDRLGQLDAVVHTAGINHPAALIDLDLEDFDAIQRVNVRGTFVVNKQSARRIRGGGSIVNARDHDGHPLELLAFPDQGTPAEWQTPSAPSSLLGSITPPSP